MQEILEELINKETCSKADLRQLKGGLKFPDIRIEIVKNLHELTKTRPKNQQTAQFMTNTLILIDQIANENNFLDEAEEDEAEREKNSDSYKEFKRQFTLLWSEVMKWDKTREIHKRILSLLPEKVIKHLTKPLHMSDYFLSAFDFGRYLRKIYMTTVPKLSWV